MSETMKDYENELEASFRKIEEGDILQGTVVSVDENEVTLDLNYYASGVISAEDYSREPGFSLKENVHPGDIVSGTVVNKDEKGRIRLSRIEAADVIGWEKLKEYMDTKEVLDVTVKGVVKGGVVAYVEDIRGFIPASKLGLNYVDNTEDYLNKQIQVQVIDVQKDARKLVLSARDVLRKKEQEEKKNKISNIQVGFVTEATVESLQTYGVFVRLDNGVSGLVHISQIAGRRIKHPSEVLAVGDKVKVKVIAIKDGKLSLSIREAQEQEPAEVKEEYFELPESKEQATTSLGSLFANIKL